MRVNSHSKWFPKVRTGGFPPARFAMLSHRNIQQLRLKDRIQSAAM